MRDLGDFDHSCPVGPASAPADEGAFAQLDGEWTVAHRRRLRTMAGCQAWESFLGRCVIHSLLGGRGHVEDHLAMTDVGEERWARLRLCDPMVAGWATWAISQAQEARLIGLPISGGWSFRGEAMLGGRTVLVRELWLRPGPHSIGWSRTFSDDDGRTWETAHIMELVRAGERWSG